MMVLARKEGEALMNGNEIVVKVLRVDSDSITVCIDSPSEAATARSDLLGTHSLGVGARSES